MDRELIAYLDERFREVNEELGAFLEDMRGELRVVAEGVLRVDEKLESFRRPSEERSEEILSTLRRLPSYAVLDGRVAALEDWRGRQGRDPIEVIRERYGPKATP